MSFLDNLENNLKALEGAEPSGLDNHARKELERHRAVATAPWAQKLKTAPYTQTVLEQINRAGYQIRVKVNIVWLNGTLRLEARGHRLELRPTPNGVMAVQLKGTEELKRELVDLSGTPQALLGDWIAVLEDQKKADDAAAAQSIADED